MPKISYLQSPDNGTDTTEVTQAVIEQKIANIEALLHGLIDEDNMLHYQDGSVPLQINPGVISDMPSEFKPVNHAMKFFANETADDSVKEKSWDKIINIADNNPSFHNIGGIEDGEMIWEMSNQMNDYTEIFEGIYSVENKEGGVKNKIIEVPPNYVPVTWGDLWEYVEGSFTKAEEVEFDDKPYFVVNNVFGNKEEFLEQMGIQVPEEYVQNVQIERMGSFVKENNAVVPVIYVGIKSFPQLEFNEQENKAGWSGDFEMKHVSYGADRNGFILVRTIVSALFKVLP